MDLSRYDAFIFDLDGTLIDSEVYHAQAFADAVRSLCGYELATDEKREFFACHSLRFSVILNERHGLCLDPEVVLALKRERVQEIFKADLFDGALAFLEAWKGRVPMGLASNSPASFVRPAMEAAGLLDFFECIIMADDVVHRKPNPEMIEKTLMCLGTDPSKTLVFEDQLIGVEAAHAAGTDVVIVDNGQSIEFPKGIPVLSWPELLKSTEQK